MACHALSHVFTTELGLPHGAALGILMTAWCKYMLTDETEAIADFCTLVWQVPSCPSQIQTAQNGISAFQDFLCSSGLPVTLREAGLCDVSIEHLARLALPDMAGTLGRQLPGLGLRRGSQSYSWPGDSCCKAKMPVAAVQRMRSYPFAQGLFYHVILSYFIGINFALNLFVERNGERGASLAAGASRYNRAKADHLQYKRGVSNL